MAKTKTSRFGPRGNLIARGKDFEMYRYVRGPFQVVRLFGRCGPALLQELRRKVLQENKSTAIDTYSLTDPDLPLARELALTARRYRNIGKSIVIVNARGPIRDLIRATAPEELIPFVVTEQLLEGSPAGFMARLRTANQMLSRVQSGVKTDPVWKLSDRDSLWLCPYCADIQDHIRLHAKGIPIETTAELIVIHLLEDCQSYRNRRGLREQHELADKLKRINQDKLMASKESASALVSRVVELQDQVKEADELRHSVEVASKRQSHMLPAKAPDLDGIQFGLGYRPSQRVSGDFYDFVQLDDGRLGVIIGDVSGHGIEAAILMGVAKKLINIRLRDTSDPLAALQLANRDIFPDLDRQTFVTAFVGIIDPKTQTITHARAGHNPVILHNPDRNPDTLQLEPKGIVLGMDEGPRFNAAMALEITKLQPGDVLFLYTDGLSEAMNPDEEEFGIDRILNLIRAYYQRDPDKLIDHLYEELEAFCQGIPQEDDVTMVTIKFQGKS